MLFFKVGGLVEIGGKVVGFKSQCGANHRISHPNPTFKVGDIIHIDHWGRIWVKMKE